MTKYWLPKELWSNIKSYLLLDEEMFNILRQLGEYSVTKLIENFTFEPKQIKIIKNTKIHILNRKKIILKILLDRCRYKVEIIKIQAKLEIFKKIKIENLQWKDKYMVGEQVLCFNDIIFENNKRYLQRKGVVVKIGLKSISVRLYKYEVKPKNLIGFNPVEWKEEFESETKTIFEKMFIQKNEPYYSGLFLQGKLEII
jgi:hypothetical protein